jgi:hypothetical protein
MINYVSDNNGETIAVVIPVDDWKRMKDKYPDIDGDAHDVPEWQKKLMRERRRQIENDPSLVKDDINELFDEIDRDVD